MVWWAILDLAASVCIPTSPEHEECPLRDTCHEVDVTGAGDAYIAGFLYGWTAGLGLDESASLGSACAARVIQQIGSRLEKSSQLA
ncbi:MAG: hypothetical protein IH809_04180 [Proteobacteria bacterium]|nr:hypothetical protein [Pseudomonadota bacterium]